MQNGKVNHQYNTRYASQQRCRRPLNANRNRNESQNRNGSDNGSRNKNRSRNRNRRSNESLANRSLDRSKSRSSCNSDELVANRSHHRSGNRRRSHSESVTRSCSLICAELDSRHEEINRKQLLNHYSRIDKPGFFSWTRMIYILIILITFICIVRYYTPFFKHIILKDNSNIPSHVDYALETAGGLIVNTRNTENYHPDNLVSFLGWTILRISKGPQAMLQPYVEPGECWAFKGSNGSVVIRLIDKIYLTGVTLYHIPKTISPTLSISSAPRKFSIWALKCSKDTEGTRLGTFEYDINGDPSQYFPIKHENGQPVRYIEAIFHSNHGHLNYTCVYRLRIYGVLP